ncbi:YycH family regulatory protein [Brevibacillus daliensis]|uniref:YycH family regulatory protein n=1 Tax=Brevibacillus daliensis TaxID=2892995 RepID=UPI001E5863E8|nr:two-component system activity regulator YycH [Brevibacillus daliensis]
MINNDWLEKVKSVLLVFLVLLSGVLTFLLLNNQPKLELISPATFFPSDKLGTTKQLEDLLRPESILFHYGEDKHTKAVYTDDVYRILMGEIENWYFSEFTYYPLSEQKWEALTRNQKGLELQYRSQIPISVLSQVLTIRGDVDPRLTGVDRVWLYHEQMDDAVYALFLSKKDQISFRAKTAVTSKDLNNSYLMFGKSLPEQSLHVYKQPKKSPYVVQDSLPYWHIYYLPKNSSTLSLYNYNYLPITRKQLLDTYFLDPGLVRQIVERDGTYIYTDGTRSIQIRSGQQLMTLTSPTWQTADTDIELRDQVQEATVFINQHMGWIDDFRLETVEERMDQNAQVVFRQYLGSYPLISQDAKLIDNIQVNVDKGQVLSMRRSLIDLDTFFGYKDEQVGSGEELFAYLQEKGVDINKISDVYLAYQLVEQKGYVQLIPSWVIEMEGVYNKLIDVRSARVKGGQPVGLE